MDPLLGLITKILSTSWASNKKIQRSEHHLDDVLSTIQNDSHGVIIPRQDYQDDEASGTQETNSGSNEMIEEKELIHAVTGTNGVVTKENEVGLADVHISKQGIIEDNELVISLVQPGYYQDDEASGTQETNSGSNEMIEELIHAVTNELISWYTHKELDQLSHWTDTPPKVVASTKKIGKTIRHYSSLHKILLVGDGDFSFSASLAKAFGSATNIVATSLDDSDFLKENYPSAANNIGYLQNRGGLVIHEVDATKMADHDLPCDLNFDRIIYNFPLAGFFDESRKRSLARNRNLVRLFMENAIALLDMGGEIHITHKTNSFFREWNLENLAKQCRLRLIEDVEFKLHHYPGYHNKRGFGGNEDFNCYPSRTYKFGRK